MKDIRPNFGCPKDRAWKLVFKASVRILSTYRKMIFTVYLVAFPLKQCISKRE